LRNDTFLLQKLRTKTNADFGNASFQSKRSEFRNSPILITSRIYDATSEQTAWGPNEINDRQKKLAELAVKTGPLMPK
jgi:hypothetical protein